MVILNSILPAFVIIGLGFFLKKRGLIEECTDKFLNNLAYYLVLPAMIFASIYKLPFGEIFNGKIVLGLYGISFMVFLFSAGAAYFLKKEKRGGFVTSAFRSNIAYIGFPLVLSLYGESGLAKISVITGFIAPFIIGLSIVYLSITEKKEYKKEHPAAMVFKDPLIITCIAALLFSYYNLKMPGFMFNTIDLIALMGAPLMLLTVGAGLKIDSIKRDRVLLVFVSFIKLLLLPLVSFIVFRYVIVITDPVDFNIAVLTFTFPTALSSYVLVKKYRGDYRLTSSSITITTIISLFTISLWLWILTGTG
ncbi:MAG TPA: AEC family transporter [Firmicutes bacterium]|nr:AEC family transporter [Bacillota bacterium]